MPNDYPTVRRVQTAVGRTPVRDQALDSALQQRNVGVGRSSLTPYGYGRVPAGGNDPYWNIQGVGLSDFDSMDAYQRATREELDRRDVAERLRVIRMEQDAGGPDRYDARGRYEGSMIASGSRIGDAIIRDRAAAEYMRALASGVNASSQPEPAGYGAAIAPPYDRR